MKKLRQGCRGYFLQVLQRYLCTSNAIFPQQLWLIHAWPFYNGFLKINDYIRNTTADIFKVCLKTIPVARWHPGNIQTRIHFESRDLMPVFKCCALTSK